MNEEEFDGCNSQCRRKGEHTLKYGSCEFGKRPKPTLSYFFTYIAYDGEVSGGEVFMPASLFLPWLDKAPVDYQHNFLEKLAKTKPEKRQALLEAEANSWAS